MVRPSLTEPLISAATSASVMSASDFGIISLLEYQDCTYIGSYAVFDEHMAIEIKTVGVGFGIPCPHCLYGFPPLSKSAPLFFESGSVTCGNCHKSSSLWEAALHVVRGSGGSFFAVNSLGAMMTHFLFNLAAGEHKELDLTAEGVPQDATILRLNMTPQSSDYFAQVKHGNSAGTRLLGPKVYVYGMPIGSGTAGGKIAAMVTWIRGKDAAESWVYLIDAFEAISSGRFWHVILPAHVAFEIALIPLLKRELEKRIARERVRDFLESGLGASAALNVVLPLLREISGIPQLDPAIRGQLNRLRELRNKLVHEGLAKESVTEEIAGELLTASVFGLEYLEYVRARI